MAVEFIAVCFLKARNRDMGCLLLEVSDFREGTGPLLKGLSYILGLSRTISFLINSKSAVRDLNYSYEILSLLLHVCVHITSCVRLSATLWTVCSPLGSSVHGISQARILEQVAISYSLLYNMI